MRLVCPNCSAQYEIDGSMIPDEGRDVQCSNCGHTWFELPGPANGDAGLSEDDTLAGTGSDEDEYGFEDPDPEDIPSSRAETRIEDISREMFEDEVDEPSTQVEEDDSQDAIQEFAAEPEPEEDDGNAADEVSEDEDDNAYAGAAAAVAASAAGKTAGRRPADAADLDILREEAERELSQRRAPPSESIETQTDLGLETIRQRNTPSRALRARMAHLGEDVPEDEGDDQRDTQTDHSTSNDDDGYEEPRRDLLPDIDEINSTLKPAKGSPAAAMEARQRSGFRAGFLLVLFIAIGLIFAYAQAPAIARALPDTEPALISYVDQANALRDWISDLIGN